MSKPGSLLLRSLLAVGLMIGFYALAIGVSVGLLYIPYAEIKYFDRLDARVAIFCVVGAAIVLWSIIPRPDRFVEPGPELKASDQPELFRVLASISEATGQRAPQNVYLIPDVNAWVAQRGGFMGFGSRRVMGLGLPLMQVLNVDQFRAVIAHEFGHYHGGDTMLGPWIQKTRMGVLRTLQNLGGRWIRLPFVGYAHLFFRITNAISRQQEFSADALAARVAGPQNLSDGLKQVHRAAPAFTAYWRTEYVPALQYQVRPPLGSGFTNFLAHQRISAHMDSALKEELAAPKTDPFDSHPPLAERCAALSKLDHSGSESDGRPSVALLSDLPSLERDLLCVSVDSSLKETKPVEWRDVPNLVWLPSWRESVREQAKALAGILVEDLADLSSEPERVSNKLTFAPGFLPSPEHRNAVACSLFAKSLATVLVDAGWKLRGDLGDPIECTKDEEVIQPFTVVDELSSGKLKPVDWLMLCKRLGISAIALDLSGAQRNNEARIERVSYRKNTVTDDGLRLFQEADLGSPVVCEIPVGTELQLSPPFESGGREWLQVRLPTGEAGYALAPSVRSRVATA